MGNVIPAPAPAGLTARRAVAAPRDEATPALAVEGLSKQFGSGTDAVTAVDDVSFRIEQGTVVGLLGPTGRARQRR